MESSLENPSLLQNLLVHSFCSFPFCNKTNRNKQTHWNKWTNSIFILMWGEFENVKIWSVLRRLLYHPAWSDFLHEVTLCLIVARNYTIIQETENTTTKSIQKTKLVHFWLTYEKVWETIPWWWSCSYFLS